MSFDKKKQIFCVGALTIVIFACADTVTIISASLVENLACVLSYHGGETSLFAVYPPRVKYNFPRLRDARLERDSTETIAGFQFRAS